MTVHSNLETCPPPVISVDLSLLPHVNASLNALAILLLLAGFVMIKRKKLTAHASCMIAAFATSALFLVCYTVHYIWRFKVKHGAHTPYHGDGIIKTLYYVMLTSHIVLAAVVPVIAIWLIYLGATEQFTTHRRVARVGLPIWLYVSVTGVLIYLMLYHW